MKVHKSLTNGKSNGRICFESLRRVLALDPKKIHPYTAIIDTSHVGKAHAYHIYRLFDQLGITMQDSVDNHVFRVNVPALKKMVVMRMWEPDGGFICNKCAGIKHGHERCTNKGLSSTCRTCHADIVAQWRLNQNENESERKKRQCADLKKKEAAGFADLSSQNLSPEEMIHDAARGRINWYA